jgi:hypothetical protein
MIGKTRVKDFYYKDSIFVSEYFYSYNRKIPSETTGPFKQKLNYLLTALKMIPHFFLFHHPI